MQFCLVTKPVEVDRRSSDKRGGALFNFLKIITTVSQEEKVMFHPHYKHSRSSQSCRGALHNSEKEKFGYHH